MADTKTKKPRKPITVLRKRKVLHIGIDLAHAPWTGTLVRALPANVENHGTHADDTTASVLQLHRPRFPEIRPQAGPGPMNRMARGMRGYDLIITHGDAVFPAVMAHTLYGQALKLAPLVHIHDGVDAVPARWWARFRHKLGMARTPAVIVPTETAARSVTGDWDVPGKRVHILPPLFPDAPKKRPRSDAIPRLMKRGAEKWIGMRAADALALADTVNALFCDLDESWHLVAFGSEEDNRKVAALFDAAGKQHRFHSTTRLAGPADAAGLFDLALLDARGGTIPPDLPALMAAGVAVALTGPGGLGALLPPESADLRFDGKTPAALVTPVAQLAADETALARVGAANAAFAAGKGDVRPYLSVLAATLGLSSLEEH